MSNFLNLTERQKFWRTIRPELAMLLRNIASSELGFAELGKKFKKFFQIFLKNFEKIF